MSTRDIRRRRPPERERSQQALQLRLAGMDYDSIAARLGYRDHSGPRKAVERLLDRREAEGAERYRKVEGDRLDRLQTAVWANAMRGDVESVRTCLSIMARRAKLFGLDAPTAVSFQMSDTEFAASVAELFDALGHDGRTAALRELGVRPDIVDGEVVDVVDADAGTTAPDADAGAVVQPDPVAGTTTPDADPDAGTATPVAGAVVPPTTAELPPVPLHLVLSRRGAGDESWSNL